MPESTISDSAFSENERGIVVKKSGQLSITRCTINRCKDRAIDVRNNSKCVMAENLISNNLFGVKVLQNSSVTLVSNHIVNTVESALNISHAVEISQLDRNEIKNNGTGKN